MATKVQEAAAQPDPLDSGHLIDACIYHNWAAQDELVEHLSVEWRAYIGMRRVPDDHTVRPPASVLPGRHFPSLFGHYLRGRPDGTLAERLASNRVTRTDPTAGDRPGQAVLDYLEHDEVGRAVLCHERALPVPAILNVPLAMELTRAANRWSRERWLSADSRLRGTILAATQDPEEGAAQIRAFGADDRFVAVLFGANALAKPLGHPVYRPMLAAAAELDLPIMIHSGADSTSDTLSQPTAGGLPATYTEFFTHAAHSLMTHLSNLVSQGVFDQFPRLKVMALGAGVGWVTPYLWRSDTSFRAHRKDAPWMRRLPSEYMVEHVRVGTAPIDEAPPGALAAYVGSEPVARKLITFASGYPAWHSSGWRDVVAALPAEWRDSVLSTNAASFFRQ